MHGAGALGVLVGHGHALVVLGDLRNLRIVGDEVADLLGEGLADRPMPPTGWNMVVWNSYSEKLARLPHRPDFRMSDRAIGAPGTGAAPRPPPGSFS